MALVRLVQQGKARFAADAGQYLRLEKGQAVPKFADLADHETASSAMEEAAAVLQAAADHVAADPDRSELIDLVFRFVLQALHVKEREPACAVAFFFQNSRASRFSCSVTVCFDGLLYCSGNRFQFVLSKF